MAGTTRLVDAPVFAQLERTLLAAIVLSREGGRGRRVLWSGAIGVAAALALTLAASVSLNEAVAMSVPSLVRTNLEERAWTLTPDFAGQAPDRSRAERWLQQQGGGISNFELSRSPHVAVAASVGLMAIVDGQGRVVSSACSPAPY